MKLPLTPVATGGFLFLIGVMGTRPLVSLYAVELGIGPEEIGVLVAVFALIPLALASVAGSWMDRHGTGRALLVSALVGATGLVVPALVAGRTGLYLSQLIVGSGFTVFILAAQNQTGRAATGSWDRERNMAIFSMGIALGSLAGPLMGGWFAETMGFRAAFFLLAVPTAATILLIWPLIHEDKATEAAAREGAPNALPSLRAPFRVLGYHPFMGRAILISSLILIGKDMYIAYFPVFALDAGLGASVIGLIVALHNGGGVLMRFCMLPLVRVAGKDRVIVYSIMVAAACFVILPLFDGVVALAVLSLVMGMGLGLGQPLSITRTINLSPPAKVGEVLGFRLACNRGTQVVTPLAVGGVLIFIGVPGIFVAVGALIGLGSTRLSVPEEVETAGVRDS